MRSEGKSLKKSEMHDTIKSQIWLIEKLVEWG